jgi:signal transduction histidine kinase
VVKKYCRIQIQDNGIGFEQKYAEQIFKMFKRLHGNSEYAGTGIGLAICKKIIEEHGGYISAISEVNNGTTFTISFPLETPVLVQVADNSL